MASDERARFSVVFGSIVNPHFDKNTVEVRVRGLKVNEGVTGPNAVLFLHRSTRIKKSTLTFNFYPVTND